MSWFALSTPRPDAGRSPDYTSNGTEIIPGEDSEDEPDEAESAHEPNKGESAYESNDWWRKAEVGVTLVTGLHYSPGQQFYDSEGSESDPNVWSNSGLLAYKGDSEHESFLIDNLMRLRPVCVRTNGTSYAAPMKNGTYTAEMIKDMANKLRNLKARPLFRDEYDYFNELYDEESESTD
jgi:hypothetical protein